MCRAHALVLALAFAFPEAGFFGKSLCSMLFATVPRTLNHSKRMSTFFFNVAQADIEI